MKKTPLPKAIRELRTAVYGETLSTLRVVELIAKIDKTREFLRHGYSSLHQYLVKGLKYSDGAANRRIRAARLSHKETRVFELLKKREVSLCTLSLVLDHPAMLNQIAGKSKREVEELLALHQSGSTQMKERVVPVVVKRIKQISNTPPLNFTTETIPGSPIKTEVILEERYKAIFSYSKEIKDKLERSRNFLSHKFPAGATLEEVFNLGLDLILKNYSKSTPPQKARNSTAMSNNPRYISAQLKRDIFKRDNGGCTYRHRDGSKCGSTWQIEIDHITPLALGGKTETDNLRLLCRNHNRMAAQEAKLL